MFQAYCYRPPIKLREGNVLRGVCEPSVHRGMSLPVWLSGPVFLPGGRRSLSRGDLHSKGVSIQRREHFRPGCTDGRYVPMDSLVGICKWHRCFKHFTKLTKSA